MITAALEITCETELGITDSGEGAGRGRAQATTFDTGLGRGARQKLIDWH